MFKSTKKIDPPKPMSMAEIQEDLLTFKKTETRINPQAVLESLKETDDEPISVEKFWDVFELSKLQAEQMVTIKEQINEMKSDIATHQAELEERRDTLLKEIDENLKRINEIKSQT
jgi:type I site-specific restriction endonuclease